MGTVLQKWLAVEWGLFPTEGFESPNAIQTMNTWEHFKDVLHHITLPMIVYTYGSLAYISRQARSGMLQVLKADFVRTARAKGLSERTVIWKHAVRNGMMPIITLLGTALPILLAGSLIIEYIFNIDGFGLLMITSIFQKDYNVVMGIQLIVAALTLFGLLLTDLFYAAMDPRISLK
jgi:ABC-type dipeptide/oligopeptide/nickel transport system permease component